MWYIWSVSNAVSRRQLQDYLGSNQFFFPNAFVMPSALNTIDLFVSLVIAVLTSPGELLKAEGGGEGELECVTMEHMCISLEAMGWKK